MWKINLQFSFYWFFKNIWLTFENEGFLFLRDKFSLRRAPSFNKKRGYRCVLKQKRNNRMYFFFLLSIQVYQAGNRKKELSINFYNVSFFSSAQKISSRIQFLIGLCITSRFLYFHFCECKKKKLLSFPLFRLFFLCDYQFDSKLKLLEDNLMHQFHGDFDKLYLSLSF